MESEPLKTRFVTHAHRLLCVRLTLTLICILFLVVNHRPLLSIWLTAVIAYTIVAHHLAAHPRYGRWALFLTLTLDLFWMAYLIISSGGLASPLMPLGPLYTFLFALLFPSPIALIPPLAILPIITSMSRPDYVLLTLYATINGIVIYLTNFSLSHEEQQSRQIVDLERQLKKLAIVEERNRLSREIHDGIGAALSGLIIQSEYLLSLTGVSSQTQHEIEEIKSTAEEAMDELRRTLAMMQNEFELIPQLQNYCSTLSSRHHLPIHVDIQGQAPKLSHEQQLSIFRILQESLTNVAKHAKAQNVMVHMTFTPDALDISIQDDGIGFDLQNTPKYHYGIANLHERAKKLGGDIKINTHIGLGTEVCFKQAFALAR